MLNLFDSKDTGGDFVLVPATDVDMQKPNRKSLQRLCTTRHEVSKEVTYDTAADAEVIKGHPAENAGEELPQSILQQINPGLPLWKHYG